MAQALPVTKLATLLVKTLAKPLSKRIKHEFSRYDWTKNVLISIGQATHVVTSRMTIWSAGYQVRTIKRLEPEKALANGADLFGESLVFGVSVGALLFEYNRSKEKEEKTRAKKLAETKAEHAAMRAKLQSLDLRLKAVEKVVKYNSESLLNLGGSRYEAPSQDVLVPIVDDEEEKEFEEKIAKESGEIQTQKPRPGSGPGSRSKDPTEEGQFPGAREDKPWWKIW